MTQALIDKLIALTGPSREVDAEGARYPKWMRTSFFMRSTFEAALAGERARRNLLNQDPYANWRKVKRVVAKAEKAAVALLRAKGAET